MLQVEVCFLCCRLVSRRCHKISTIHPLFLVPRRTGRGALHHPDPSLSPPQRLGIEVMDNTHPWHHARDERPNRAHVTERR